MVVALASATTQTNLICVALPKLALTSTAFVLVIYSPFKYVTIRISLHQPVHCFASPKCTYLMKGRHQLTFVILGCHRTGFFRRRRGLWCQKKVWREKVEIRKSANQGRTHQGTLGDFGLLSLSHARFPERELTSRNKSTYQLHHSFDEDSSHTF